MTSTLRTKLLLSILGSSILPIFLVCLVLGFNIRKNSLETFFTSTGNELGHIEKVNRSFKLTTLNINR